MCKCRVSQTKSVPVAFWSTPWDGSQRSVRFRVKDETSPKPRVEAKGENGREKTCNEHLQCTRHRAGHFPLDLHEPVWVGKALLNLQMYGETSEKVEFSGSTVAPMRTVIHDLLVHFLNTVPILTSTYFPIVIIITTINTHLSLTIWQVLFQVL